MEETKRENEYLRTERERLKEELTKKNKKINELTNELEAFQQRITAYEGRLEEDSKQVRRRKEERREEISEEIRKAIKEENSIITDSLQDLNERLERIENQKAEINQQDPPPQQQRHQMTRLPPRRPPNCYTCGKLGHLARQCYFGQRPTYRRRPYNGYQQYARRNNKNFFNERQVYNNKNNKIISQESFFKMKWSDFEQPSISDTTEKLGFIQYNINKINRLRNNINNIDHRHRDNHHSTYRRNHKIITMQHNNR